MEVEGFTGTFPVSLHCETMDKPDRVGLSYSESK